MGTWFALSMLLTAYLGQPSNPPPQNARSAILIDEVSGRVLFEKNADLITFPASTTKVMTAMLLLERCRPDEKIVVPKGMPYVDGASLNLKPKEVFTASNLIKGILWRSGNDACEVAAKHVSGSVAKFATLMNERAKAIGCTNTNFTNPHGLPDKSHTTTARDLALIAREAMKDPAFRAIVAVRKGTIERSLNKVDTAIVSKNKVLDLDPTADGIKTGYTRAAKGCFIGSATRSGSRFITVVLGSEDSLLDHTALMEWGHLCFRSHDLRAEALSSFRCEVGRGATSINAGISSDRRVVMGHKLAFEPEFDQLEAPVSKNDRVGSLVVKDEHGNEERIDLIALETVMGRASTMSTVALGGLAVLSLFALRRKRSKIVNKWQS